MTTTKCMPEFNIASSRNAKAYCLRIGAHAYFISYETVVAYRGPGASQGIRIYNSWGPTTGRHMTDMGCHHFEVVSNSDFVAAASLPVGV